MPWLSLSSNPLLPSLPSCFFSPPFAWANDDVMPLCQVIPFRSVQSCHHSETVSHKVLDASLKTANSQLAGVHWETSLSLLSAQRAGHHLAYGRRLWQTLT